MDEVKFTVEIEPLEVPENGKFFESDNPEQDKLDDQEIQKRLDAGDYTAWCSIVVGVTWNDFQAYDTLDGVSLENPTPEVLEEAVREEGMKEAALDSLQEGLQNSYFVLKSLDTTYISN
jgi:hypothetical protein